MKFRILLAALLLAPALAFAGGKTDSPSEVLKKFVKAAFNDQDFATAMALSHGEQKEFIRMQEKGMAWLKKSAAAGDPEAKAKLAQIKAKSASFTLEIIEEQIDGDLAVVTAVWKIGDKKQAGVACFAKVNGEWKNISTEDYSKAVKARSNKK